jgi:8-hydroxy-5-deazaflavin:NADPH oxidoreductase
MKIAIIGGTGKLGNGFIARLLPTQHALAIGSREPSKAVEATIPFGDRVFAMSNSDAAGWCDIAILTIPYAAHHAILGPLNYGLRSKVVIDATVPLDFGNVFRVITESGKSAAEETAAILADSRVFAAFQTISHRVLRRTGQLEDVLVAGGSERKDEVMRLINEMNLHPIDAGPIEAARLLECMTVLLISINKQNRVKESGLKVTGL